jgi:hypothetical protein
VDGEATTAGLPQARAARVAQVDGEVTTAGLPLARAARVAQVDGEVMTTAGLPLARAESGQMTVRYVFDTLVSFSPSNCFAYLNSIITFSFFCRNGVPPRANQARDLDGYG